MKRLLNNLLIATVVILMTSTGVFAQNSLQYFRYNDQRGLNVFETSKEDTVKFDRMKVRVGGDFAMQFQSLNHSNTANNLVELGSNMNLPTANLNLDVQLAEGVRMHLRTYLSARHHEEAWVKGGYLQIDGLDFVKEGFLSGFMEVATIRIGMDEFNYGDAHFRRTDNARAIFNPFVGNYIMDAFSTEAFGELTIQKSGFIGVLGITNGKLNQSVVVNDNSDNKVSFFGKLGYDNQISSDLRFRLTGSWYINKGTTTGAYLYAGDRGGSRYYNVMHYLQDPGTGFGARNTDFTGRVQPRFKKLTAIQFNPFIKYKGLEFFGIYEIASGSFEENGAKEGKYTQMAAEAIYRFGKNEQLYIGGRYNAVKGNQVDGNPDEKVNRINIGGGWYLTKNVMTKIEYVTQTYKGDGYLNNDQYNGGEFKGFMIEAVIGF